MTPTHQIKNSMVISARILILWEISGSDAFIVLESGSERLPRSLLGGQRAMRTHGTTLRVEDSLQLTEGNFNLVQNARFYNRKLGRTVGRVVPTETSSCSCDARSVHFYFRDRPVDILKMFW